MQQRRERVAEVFKQYDDQGTETDTESACWLAAKVESAGATPVVTPFPYSRIDPVQARVQCGDRAFDGLPLFDCPYTDAGGVTGTASIGVGELPPHWGTSEGQAFMEARRSNTHRAMVAVCGGDRYNMPPGLPLLNAGVAPDVHISPKSEPGGEARNIFDGGGRLYLLGGFERPFTSSRRPLARCC